MSDAVIIEAAINGATKESRNPNVPITDDERYGACIVGERDSHTAIIADGLRRQWELRIRIRFPAQVGAVGR